MKISSGNGTKFSGAEIISTPVLSKAFKDNDLSRFTTFNKFARAVFVLEANSAQETLAREFQSRLLDPRLTAVDRERIQREYELKLASLSRYSGQTMTVLCSRSSAAQAPAGARAAGPSSSRPARRPRASTGR